MAKSESTKIEFGYFHDYESEQFAFYRIPKVLFTDEYFRNLSSDAKVLYGLMLDRMALSIRHQWFDEEGKVYIIFMDMKEKKTGKGNNFPTNCREVQQMKDMEINEKIRYFRKQRGLSQELLAERTGINVNTIRKYEIGIRKPKVEQLKKIADGLEISVIEFLDIEIENEADLIAMLKKISPFFKWDGLLHVLVGEKFL